MKYEISESFLKEAHAAACTSWKERIEEEFPEVFNGVPDWIKELPEYKEYKKAMVL